MNTWEDSILAIRDEYTGWRFDFTKYLDRSTKLNNYHFFWEMIPMIRFIRNSEGPAWTDKACQIFLNIPHKDIELEEDRWEFIYYHECLHQLFETFEVGNQIKKETGSYNHKLLNIASDCIINDYVKLNCHLEYPSENLITPEYIKSAYGVEYDRKTDDQYDLYMKLKEVQDLIEDDPLVQQMHDDLPEIDIDMNGGSSPNVKTTKLPTSDDWKQGSKAARKMANDILAKYNNMAKKNSNGKLSVDEAISMTEQAIAEIRKMIGNPVVSAKESVFRVMNSSEFIAEAETGKTVDSEHQTFEQGWDYAVNDVIRQAEQLIQSLGTGGGGGGMDGDDEVLQQVPENDPTEESPFLPKPNMKGGKPQGSDKQDSDKQDDENKSADDFAKDAQNAADRAKKAADQAEQKARDAENEAAQSGDSDDMKNAKNARKAADNAKKSAEAAQDAADNAAQSAGNGDKESAKKSAEKAENEAAVAESEAGMNHDESVGQGNPDDFARNAESYADKAKQFADNAKASADAAQAKADRTGDAGDLTEAKKAKRSAEKAKEAAVKAAEFAKEAKNAADKNDAGKAKNASVKAKAEANKAEQYAAKAEDPTENNNPYGPDGVEWNDNDRETEEKNREWGKQAAEIHTYAEKKIGKMDEKDARSVIRRFTSGADASLSDFVRKCESSSQPKRGIIVQTPMQQRNVAWAEKFSDIIKNTVKQYVKKRSNEWFSTYRRPNRRQGIMHDGDIVKKGKMRKKDKLTISLAFYVDVSYSMNQDAINNIFEFIYRLDDHIKNQYRTVEVVEDCIFDTFAFNYEVKRIIRPNKPYKDGGTLELDKLLDRVYSLTSDSMINVILTDAEMDFQISRIKEQLKRLPGNVVFITNNNGVGTTLAPLTDMKGVECGNKFELITVPGDFNITSKDFKQI